MKVAIIDMFNLPYSCCLTNALTKQGCEAVMVASRIPQTPWAQGRSYEHWEHFYRITSRLTKTKIRTYLRGCEHLFDMIRLLRRLQHWKPDVIHFQWIPFPMVDKPFLERFRKIAPLLLTVHDTKQFHGTPSSCLQLTGLKTAYRCFDHYIVHTQYSKEALMRQLRLSKDSITVIPLGVLYYRNLIDNLVRLEQISQITSKKKVLFFGVLKPYKGVDVLLKAFARLPGSVAKGTVLQIVGYPTMSVEPLRNMARHLGIEERVHWDLRFVGEDEVTKYFAQADVVVLPYRRIDQSGVLMTALAFEKPIVASRVGGFPETICEGIHGFLVEPGDAVSLAQALTRILTDDELRVRMAENIRELTSSGELSWESIATKTLEVYKYVVTTRGGHIRDELSSVNNNGKK